MSNSGSGREPSYFQQKAKELASRLEKETASIKSKDFWTTKNIILVSVPLSILVLLILFKPKFVTIENKKGERVRCFRKLLIWTLVFAAAVYGGLYGYKNYYLKNKY